MTTDNPLSPAPLDFRFGRDGREVSAVTPGEGEQTRVSVSYWKSQKRVFVSALEVTVKHENGFTSESFMMFATRQWRRPLADMPRFNAKTLEALVAEVQAKLARRTDNSFEAIEQALQQVVA